MEEVLLTMDMKIKLSIFSKLWSDVPHLNLMQSPALLTSLSFGVERNWSEKTGCRLILLLSIGTD